MQPRLNRDRRGGVKSIYEPSMTYARLVQYMFNDVMVQHQLRCRIIGVITPGIDLRALLQKCSSFIT